MIDMRSISTRLFLAEDGIWYSSDKQIISYPTGGNEASFAIEDNLFWFRHRNNCISSVVETFPPENHGTIFDIGGGNGFVSLELANAGFDVALVEPGRVGAVNARNRGLENVICATTDTAQFKHHSLPAVGLFDVVEHIEDDLSFLKSIRSLIKKGGRLYVTVPSYSFLWSAADVWVGHFRRYSLKNICEVLKSAGFEIEFSSYIFRVLPIPILLFRTLPYTMGLSKADKKAMKVPFDHAIKVGLIASILGSVLHSEIEKLKNKKAMHFGGSCLVVAKSP